MADIKFTVEVDSTKGTVVIKELDKNVDQLGKTSQISSVNIGGLWKQVLAGAGIAMGVSQAIRGLTGFMKSAVSAAAIQEDANRALDASLEITGRNVKGLSDHFKNYANALQGATIYGNEEIQNVQTLLIQLTKLDKQKSQGYQVEGMAPVYEDPDLREPKMWGANIA